MGRDSPTSEHTSQAASHENAPDETSIELLGTEAPAPSKKASRFQSRTDFTPLPKTVRYVPKPKVRVTRRLHAYALPLQNNAQSDEWERQCCSDQRMSNFDVSSANLTTKRTLSNKRTRDCSPALAVLAGQLDCANTDWNRSTGHISSCLIS